MSEIRTNFIVAVAAMMLGAFGGYSFNPHLPMPGRDAIAAPALAPQPYVADSGASEADPSWYKWASVSDY